MSAIVLAAINAKWIHPSLALRLLKANLGEYESRAEILEFALRQPLAEKTEALLAARPWILGLSVSIWNHLQTLELLEALADRWPSPRPVIVLGGPEVSHLDEDAEIFRYADWVVRGEGEPVFRDLCRSILEGETTGGAGRGKFIDAETTDLSAVDPGYRLYTEEDLRRKLVYVESSRGCPFGCEFCLSSLDRKVREFPIEPFLKNMETMIRRGAKTFKFLDRTFNLDIERSRRIMAFFLEHASSLCVHFEIFPSGFPPELMDLARRFPPGSLRLELGIQTLNREIAALIGRPGNPGKELEVLAFLSGETGAVVHADLIAGLPGEDLASFAAGFDRLWTAMTSRSGAGHGEIQVGILKRLPGTPLARHDRAFGMRYQAAPPYEALETAALGAKDLGRLKNFARFWELMVNRRPFPNMTAALVPPGKTVFEKFMALSDSLLVRFGRNWGIDREDLREAISTS